MDKSILLVDDEKEIVNFLEHFLKRMKLPSIKATSGEEALDMYDKDKVHAVFLDIQMKGLDGLAVLREIKERDPEAQVIMITGRFEKEVQDKARELGALDYITKPLDLGDLKEKINRYILQ